MGHEEDLEKMSAAYQELLEKELEPYLKDKDKIPMPINTENYTKYSLKDQDINKICEKYGVDCNKLKSYLIHNSQGGGFHTSHFDLIYRIVNIRNLIFQSPIPLEYRIEVNKEPVPDFGMWQLGKLLESINVQSNVIGMIVKALNKNSSNKNDFGISKFQKEVIFKILETSNNRKNQQNQAVGIGIVAPTASGKTLSFLIPVLVNALIRVSEGKKEVSSLLIYPRKALERDQLKTILGIIDNLNKILNQDKKENEKRIFITLGIDDGDTPRRNQVKDGNPFRGLKCIKAGCDGNLVYSKNKMGKTIVRCEKCNDEYNYILATKEDIWSDKPTILISNIHTLYRRLMDKNTVIMYSNLDYVILDEVHVYTDYFGGFVRYILGMLKYASRQSNPTFIFSSATIPNPKDFLKTLFGQNVEVVDFSEVYNDENKNNTENGQNRNDNSIKTQYKRLIIRLYLLPNPQRSIETLYQAVALAVTLWAHKFDQKVISFIDSVSEIATLGDYIKSVTLGNRQGREVLDHLNIGDPLDDYNWTTIAPENTDSQFLTGTFKNSIGTHHGKLDLRKRSEIESDFQGNKIRHLMSTSTLELGIDISNVGIVIQYKLPISSEGVIQRIGRAGRDTKSFRIALGIILLPSSPIGTLYMYDEDLRKRFADIKANKPYGVGYDSDVIKLQALLSLVLFKRALEGKETYITRIKDLNKAAIAIDEILNDLKCIDNFNSKVGLLDDQDLKNKKALLQKLLQDILKEINNYIDTKGLPLRSINKNTDIDNIIQTIDSHRKNITEFLYHLSEVEKMITSLEVDLKSLKNTFIYYDKGKTQETDPITFLKHTFGKAYELLNSLKEEIEHASGTSNNLNIDNWIKEKEMDIKDLLANLNQINIYNENYDTDQKITEISIEISIKAKEAEKRLKKEKGVKPKFASINVVKSFSSILSKISEDEEKGSLSKTISFLTSTGNVSPNLHDILNGLKTVDISTYYIGKNVNYLHKALRKSDEYGYDIFDVINELYNNRIKFSLMLQPPFPELEEIEIEAK